MQFRQPSDSARQHGFAVMTALALIIIIGGAGAALLTLSTATATNQAHDLLGIQAHYAARAGIEYGVYKAVHDNLDCSTPVIQTLAMPASLSRFTVTLVCTSTSHTEALSFKVWQLRATACNQPAGGACPGEAGLNSIERTQRATVTQ